MSTVTCELKSEKLQAKDAAIDGVPGNIALRRAVFRRRKGVDKLERVAGFGRFECEGLGYGMRR